MTTSSCDLQMNVIMLQIYACFYKVDIIWNYSLAFEATIVKFFMGKQQ